MGSVAGEGLGVIAWQEFPTVAEADREFLSATHGVHAQTLGHTTLTTCQSFFEDVRFG